MASWRVILTHLYSPQARKGTIPRQRAEGIAGHATDLDESWGSGPPLIGPAEALVMALAGRTVAFDDLAGGGVAVLRSRV